jgi:hypothetical protein
LIWVDRLAIVLGVALVPILFWLGSSDPRGAHLDPAGLLKAILMLVGAPWLFIRGLIWAFRPRYY